MAGSPQAISRAGPSDWTLDYAEVRKRAVEFTHAMSKTLWTDYNLSDPGVTILEQVCYALTELPYRADLPVALLLADPQTGRVDLRRQALYPAWSILPCNPVTVEDMRRLVIDRVAAVANVWFTPVKEMTPRGPGGLYDVAILALDDQGGHPRHPRRHAEAFDDHDDESDPDLLEPDGREPHWRGRDDDDPDHEERPRGHHDDHDRWRHDHHDRRDHRRRHRRLIDEVAQCYIAHRSLCEDLRSVVVLRPLDIEVHAVLELDDGCDPSDTLASVLFQLGLFVAPEPARTDLKVQLAAERRSADIFTGPLMARGFIAHDQLCARPDEIKADDLRQVLATTTGVLGVDSLAIRLAGRTHEHATPIEVPNDRFARVNADIEHARQPIRLHRRGRVCSIDPLRVRRVMNQLWARHRQTWPLRSQYPDHYRMTRRDPVLLTEYTSIQHQFPRVYGLAGGDATLDQAPRRAAQINQLKGYLMPFDQLMADYFSQLGLIRTLFSAKAGRETTCAWQSLRPIVPDVEPVLAPGYDAGLASLSAAQDPVLTRRNAVLDFLLGLYAQQIRPPGGVEATVDDAKLIEAKSALLGNVAVLSRTRGRGTDYLRPPSERTASGVERLSRPRLRLLDIETAERRGKSSTEPHHAADWSESVVVQEVTFGRPLPDDVQPRGQDDFRPLGAWEEETVVPEGPSPLSGRVVHSALVAGAWPPGSLPVPQARGVVDDPLGLRRRPGALVDRGRVRRRARHLRLRPSSHPCGAPPPSSFPRPRAGRRGMASAEIRVRPG